MNNLTYADALIKARRYEALSEVKWEDFIRAKSSTEDSIVDGGKSSVKDSIVNGGKSAGKAVLNAGKSTGDWIKAHPGKTAGIAAGVTAATAAGIAAKKIHDKKVADKKAGVQKENYEYDEYYDLLEAVSECLSVDELLAEDASNMIIGVADKILEEAEQNNANKVKSSVKDSIVNGGKSAGKAVLNAGKSTGDWIKAHPGKTAGIAAATAAAVGAGVAAKKIHDKKVADKKAGVQKENYEYDGYNTLVECVISNFMSDEEIMAENASEIAMSTADYMIENADRI